MQSVSVRTTVWLDWKRRQKTKGKPLAAQTIYDYEGYVRRSKSLRKVFAKAGVPWAGTHIFRRTVSTWLDASGAALAEIANQLGHADTNVTANYLGRTGTPTRAATVMVLQTAKPMLQAV